MPHPNTQKLDQSVPEQRCYIAFANMPTTPSPPPPASQQCVHMCLSETNPPPILFLPQEVSDPLVTQSPVPVDDELPTFIYIQPIFTAHLRTTEHCLSECVLRKKGHSATETIKDWFCISPLLPL